MDIGQVKFSQGDDLEQSQPNVQAGTKLVRHLSTTLKSHTYQYLVSYLGVCNGAHPNREQHHVSPDQQACDGRIRLSSILLTF